MKVTIAGSRTLVMNKPKLLLSLIQELWYQSPGLIIPESAGILLKCGDEGLFLKRKANEDMDNVASWSYVAGGIENGESPYQAAIRECQEEIGSVPPYELKGEFQYGPFVTFLGEVKNKDFEIQLNGEHESFGWYNFTDQSLEPLHPGVYPALQAFGLV